MNYWITSDQHWGHANIIRLCDRPFYSVEDMDKTMLYLWNSVVKDGDIVYHLGDMFWSEFSAYTIFPQLKGKIILILGNHDKKWKRVYTKFAQQNMLIISNPATVIKEPIDAILTHYPTKELDIFYPHKLHFHGHIHNNNNNNNFIIDNRINVCVENTNYIPINLEKFKGK